MEPSDQSIIGKKPGRKRKQTSDSTEPSSTSITNNDTSSTNTTPTPSNNKKRIKKYCPDDVNYDLACEWKNCKQIINNMDDYLAHIDEHLNAYSSTNSNNQLQTQFECNWRDCTNEEFNCEFTFKRHVRYHAFHTKLKIIGTSVLKSLEEQSPDQQAPKCSLDTETRNLIPELPFKFECSWHMCDYSTDNPELFYRHIKIHVDEYPKKLTNAQCKWNECESIIKDKNRLVEHMRHHSQEKLVSCPVCGALFSSFTKFIDHSNRSCELRGGSLCFQCSHCNKKFSTNNLLKEHIRKHINKTKCPICDMTCIDKNDLSKHILYKHTTHKAFKCDQCEHTCKTQNDLNKHINLKHDENRTEYSCDECEFKTKDVNSMKRHMLKFHMNNENALNFKDGQPFSSSYMCHVEGCGKVYCQGTTLSKHLKTTHNFQWPSGHSRFRYKLEADGFYRLQTLRYESIELVELLLNKNVTTVDETTSNSNEQEATININSENNLLQTSHFSSAQESYLNNENNNDQQQTTFVELEKVSIIQNVDNINKNQRIDFDLENFFTNSNLLNTTNTVTTATSTSTSNSDQTYACLNDPNNSIVVTNGINDFKIFSMERYLDDSSRF